MKRWRLDPTAFVLVATAAAGCGHGDAPLPSPGEGSDAPSRFELAARDTLCRRDAIEPGQSLSRPEAIETALIFMTGSPSGSYHAVGCAIARVFERETRRRMVLVNGGGSGENLEKLISGQADVIISQGDIAHHEYRGSGWVQRLLRRAPGRRLRAVMGLHYEQVLAIGRAGLNSVEDIDDSTRVVIGGATSGTIGNALLVLQAQGLATDTPYTRPYTRVQASRGALPLLADTTDAGVDVVFLTGALDPALRDTIRALGARVLPMGEDMRGHLAREHRYYRDNAPLRTVQIRALLLVRRNMPEPTVRSLLEAIHGDIGSSVSLIRDSTVEAARYDIVDDSTLTRDVSVPVHRAAAEIFCAAKGTACAYTRTFRRLAGAAVGLIAIGSLLFGIAFVGPVRRFVLRFFPRIALSDAFGSSGFVSRWRWLLIPVFAVVVVLSGTLLVSLIEVWHSLGSGLSSAFTNRSFVDNVVWMLVFAASGYENQTFPASILAQIMSAATVVIAVGGVLFLVGIVTSDGFARKMKMDLRSDVRRLRSHIIICGWNRRAPALVRLLCGTQMEDRHLKIAIVAELGFDPIERFGLSERQTVYVSGSPMKLANLEAAELARADTVVILSSDTPSLEDRDARTLAIAAQVEKFARRAYGATEPIRSIHTVAELADPENRDLFHAASIDQIVCQTEVDEQLLAQSVLNPGLTHFMEEILTVDERSEIYEVPVRPEEKYVGLTYDEALVGARADGFLLLAINCGKGRRPARNGAEGRALLANPTAADERGYRINPGDSLLFLAPDQSSLERVFGSAAEWRSALLE